VIEAIAWDIDGTLIDSEPTHHAALIEVCARYGVAIPPKDQWFTGVAMEQVFEALKGRLPAGLEQALFLGEIVDAYVAMAPRLRAFPGARETVQAFAEAGLLQGCVSNSVRRIVDANLVALGCADLIAFSISRDEVERGKPDPEPYALACRRFGLDAPRVLAVEDSPVGAAAARAAGLPVVRIDEYDWAFGAVIEAVSARPDT
jgi:HAD superfamily hydrolase (TIGR01509 family)